MTLNPARIRALIAADETGPTMTAAVADDVVRLLVLDAEHVAGEEVQR